MKTLLALLLMPCFAMAQKPLTDAQKRHWRDGDMAIKVVVSKPYLRTVNGRRVLSVKFTNNSPFLVNGADFNIMSIGGDSPVDVDSLFSVRNVPAHGFKVVDIAQSGRHYDLMSGLKWMRIRELDYCGAWPLDNDRPDPFKCDDTVTD